MPKHEWKADLFMAVNTLPSAKMHNGPEPVELELRVEEWLKKNGVPGESFGAIRWMGDRYVHYLVRLEKDGLISITNTPHAKWPIEIPIWDQDADTSLPDEDEEGASKKSDEGDMRLDEIEDDEDWDDDENEDDEGESENDDDGEKGGGEMLARIFGRFYDGRRWRKQATISDWKCSCGQINTLKSKDCEFCGRLPKATLRQSVQFGIIDEEQAEAYGENSNRARILHATASYRQNAEGVIELRVRLPHSVELHQVGHEYRAVIPADASIPKH